MVQGAEASITLNLGAGGSKVRVLQDTLGGEERYTEVIHQRRGETFWAVFDRIVPAANKYMANIFNATSTKKVEIKRIWVFNWQIAAVTGVLLEYELRRITARTLGTSITPVAADSNYSLTASITADHASTAVTDSSLLLRGVCSSEELVQTALQLLNTIVLPKHALIYEQRPDTDPIILRQNQGVVIKNITNSAVGTVSTIVEFTEEDV